MIENIAMNMKKMGLYCLSVMASLGAFTTASAQLPADFPSMTVTTCDPAAVGDGYIFLEVTDAAADGGYYLMMLKNDGTPFWYKKVPDHNYDFKVLPNGNLHYAEFYHTHSWTGGGDCTHEILDNNYNPKETIRAGNGYNADAHEFQMLPNGHVLLQSYYKTQMDISKYVVGGYPNAMVAGAVIQELDAERNVVFQWRSWDHFSLLGYYGPYLNQNNPAGKQPVIDAFHLNTLVVDTDGNLLVSNFGMDVWKINRQTGAIMWRLGGLANQFSFVGVDPLQARAHFSCHSVSRLENGNILLYCNADQLATRSSKVYEYKLDEVNKVATLVWSHTPPTPYYAWHYGSAQRLPNGNTFIGWGGANVILGIGTNQAIPACTEVAPDGTVVFEMKFNDVKVASYRAYRFPYPPATQAKIASAFMLTAGNSYDFGDTGVSMDVNTGGSGYNEATVNREPYAPVDPLFNGQAPRVLPVRVKMTAVSINALEAQINFDTASFGLSTPANLTVYYREQAGQGLFVPQFTQYNSVTHQVQATVTMTAQAGQLGEFIFGYPDVTEVALPPTLAAVENYRGVQPYEFVGPLPASPGTKYSVNQERPVGLAWSPNGFAGGYHVQIATTKDFAAPVVDVPYQTNAFYVWGDAAPGTTYYYRVNTSNEGGTSGWASGSFQTVAPMVRITSPNGFEGWQRGLKYFVQWQGNTPEAVVIDLYKGGVFLTTLTTNAANTGAYRWSVPLDLIPGNDYSIKVRSSTTAALFDDSDAVFGIDGAFTNVAPLFSGYALSGKAGEALLLAPAKILARASDPDGDAVSLTRVFGPSAQGGTVALADAVTYSPPSGFAGTDTFEVELTDAHGANVRGTITITVTAPATGTAAQAKNLTQFTLNEGKAEMVFRGIPGRSYLIQRSSDLANWSDLGTATAGPDGKIPFTDPAPPVPQGFYRTQAK